MQQVVQVVRVRMQQFLSSSLSFLLVSYAPAYIFHGLQCLQGCTAPGMDSSMGCSPFGCVPYPPCSISYTCVPSFPSSILPTPLTQAPHAWLLGSAFPSSGSIVEMAGTSCIWHRMAPNLLP